MLDHVHDHELSSRQRLGHHLPFGEAFAEDGAAVAHHEITELLVSFSLHRDVHVAKLLDVFVILFVQIALDFREIIDRLHSVHLPVI